MRILFDGPYEPQPKSGVLRYFYEISHHLSQKSSTAFSRKCNPISVSKISLPPFQHFRPHKISFLTELLWNRIQHTVPFQIIHPTEFEFSPTGHHFATKSAKIVITIHDLIHEKYGAPGNLYNEVKRTQFYSKADGYIFVSHSTKNDFAEIYPHLFQSRPSRVIYHGKNFEPSRNSLKKNSNQFLFVGSREGYKNFETAHKAFGKLAVENESVRLVVAGSAPTQKELSSCRAYSDRIQWVTLPNPQELRDLYANSLALLYVSKYEGFGMPVLEAMSQGCIPIAGNHSSIPEVLGNGGFIIDNTTTYDIYQAMRNCHANASLQKELTKKGFSRLRAFDWAKSANETLSFYKGL